MPTVINVSCKFKDGKRHLCPDIYTDGVWVSKTDGTECTLTDVLNELAEGVNEEAVGQIIDLRLAPVLKSLSNLVTPAATGQDVFESLAALQAATVFYHAGEEYTPKKNDYAEVTDGDRTVVYGNSADSGAPVWAYRYTVANSPFSQGQIDTLNSTVSVEWKDQVNARIVGGTGTGLIVSDAGTLTVDFAAQDDKTSTDKAVSPAYVASALAGFTGGVDEEAVRAIVQSEVSASSDIPESWRTRIIALENAMATGGGLTGVYPGVSTIIALETPDLDFVLIQGMFDAQKKALYI